MLSEPLLIAQERATAECHNRRNSRCPIEGPGSRREAPRRGDEILSPRTQADLRQPSSRGLEPCIAKEPLGAPEMRTRQPERRALGASDGSPMGLPRRLGRPGTAAYRCTSQAPAKGAMAFARRGEQVDGGGQDPHLRLFTSIAVITGARSGAILGLTWDRVDLERGLVDFMDPKLRKPRNGAPPSP